MDDQNYIKMTTCDYCGEHIDFLPFTCNRCGQSFCGNHRLPENHSCSKIKQKNFFEPLAERTTSINEEHKSKFYEEEDEMYVPGRKKCSTRWFSIGHFNLKDFLRKHIYFRIQNDVRPHLMQFLLVFIIGVVLNYVYYQTFSLTYLFIGGVNEWFRVLMYTLNYGLLNAYDLLYLIINGVYYSYFYYSFVFVLYTTITNLDDSDTWVMWAWFALIIWVLIYLFPQIV